MTKRVLLISNTAFSIRKFRKELILRLQNEGYEVILSLPERDENLENELGVKNVVIPYARRSKNVFKDLFFIKDLYKLFKFVNPDVILTFTIKPNIYGSFASRLSGHKQICTITGTGQSFLKKNYLYYGVRFLYQQAFKHHKTLIFQNENDRLFFRDNHMFKGDAHVLSGSGVNLELFDPKPYPKIEPLRFIFVGRILHLKGIDLYLDAAKYLKDAYPVKFSVVGDLEEQSYSEKIKRAHDEGIIEYFGYHEDVRSFIETHHCLVLPSLSGEGIPNSVLEANAMARPCIVSNLFGCTEIIKNGVNGYIFESGNFEDLVQVLLLFIQDSEEKRNQMGLNGRMIVEQSFSRDKVNQHYLELIESTCS